MTKLRDAFAARYGSELIPSLYGAKSVKDLVQLPHFAKYIASKDSKDDKVLHDSTDIRVYDQFQHIASAIHTTVYMTRICPERLDHLSRACKARLTPLLAQVDPDYPSELKIDTELAQCLAALDNHNALPQFYLEVSNKWKGQRLHNAPVAWIDGIARKTLQYISSTEQTSSIANNSSALGRWIDKRDNPPQTQLIPAAIDSRRRSGRFGEIDNAFVATRPLGPAAFTKKLPSSSVWCTKSRDTPSSTVLPFSAFEWSQSLTLVRGEAC